MVSDPRGLSPARLAVDGRRLIAVVFADMVGYSWLIGVDNTDTIGRLRELRSDLIDPVLVRHCGTLVSTAGDSLMITFDSIISAVRFAVDVQHGVPEFAGDYPPDRRIRFRIGINVDDVIPHRTNLHGEGVNVAARLQAICPPGTICVSRVVRDHVGNRLGLGFKKLGAIDLKNIARPTEAFLLKSAPPVATPPLALPPKRSRRTLAKFGAHSFARPRSLAYSARVGYTFGQTHPALDVGRTSVRRRPAAAIDRSVALCEPEQRPRADIPG